MKVLVTGATGHLGTNLVRRLIVAGRSVRALVRANSPREILDAFPVEPVVGDLLDFDSLKVAMRGCAVVYHTAAVYAMWEKNPETTIRPTVEGSRNVLRAAHESGISKVLYVSTVGTVGFTQDARRPLDETAFNTHSRTAYLRAKCQAEAEARAFMKDTGLPVVFVLPGMIMGGYFMRVTPSVQFVLDYLNKGAPAYFEMGLNIVDAEDVAQGTIFAEERGRPGERYILGGDNMSFKTMYESLAALTGLPGPGFRVPNILLPFLSAIMESRARKSGEAPQVSRNMVHDFRGRYGYYSTEKAHHELGYHHLEADEVLRRTVEWLMERGFVPEERRKQIRLAT